jgi:UDP-N-acetylmuramate: L-alanyl-gamma-D-glutamyl-meso-diaminopimelate ligase
MQPVNQVSDPDRILNQSLDKQRIVITGSRGTTTLTAILVHILNFYKRPCDYVISAAVHGITETSKVSGAPIIIIESKPADILRLSHHVGLITNIMWNAEEDSGTEDDFVKQFDKFADSTPKGGILLYCENDSMATVIGAKPRPDVFGIGYTIHPHTSESGKHFLVTEKMRVPVNIYGSQNFQNISAARELLRRLGITHEMFYSAISDFPL